MAEERWGREENLCALLSLMGEKEKLFHCSFAHAFLRMTGTNRNAVQCHVASVDPATLTADDDA
jgi:hypothetical protein